MNKGSSDLLLHELNERVKGLEHQAELIKTVLIVKEPESIHAAQAYDGLRKQILAGAAERRSHLVQLVAMSVAVTRGTSIDDLRPQVLEWLNGSGVVTLTSVPEGSSPKDLFEDTGGGGLDGDVVVVEPAYVDGQTGGLLRLGRARTKSVDAKAPAEAAVADAQVATVEEGK